ncbi:MAG: Macrolide export protein MacA [Verrucomicrobiales bacterium]|nr:Macrolide export protein MacA [Verrucomicrobiales bacterium]
MINFSRRTSPTLEFPVALVRRSCLACSFALILLNTSCGQKPASSAPKDSDAGAPVPVKTAQAQIRPMERTVTVTGSFNAREQSTLSVKIPGRLQKIVVDIGSVVSKGDLLAQIDPGDYELRVKQAEAALSQARARLGLSPQGDDDKIDPEKTPTIQQAKAVLEEARKNRDRIKQLTQEKILAQAELDTVEAAYTVAVGKYQDAMQDVRERQALLVQRRAELNIAQKQLIDTTITSPFDGIIQQRRASPGEFLATGIPLLSIAAVNPLRLRLEVPERESSRIAPGQPIRVTVGGNTNVYTAEISRVSPMLSESNRMLVVEADVPLAAGLKPGLFAQAVIVINTNDPALVVPESAIASFVGIEKAFIIKDHKALEKSITTGRRKNGLVEVRSGLASGDSVILNPTKMRSGQTVVEEADAKTR